MTFYKLISSQLYRGDRLHHKVYYHGSIVEVGYMQGAYHILGTSITLQPVYDNKTDKLIGFIDA